MTFRKFLIGQCSKVVHFKEPFIKFKMSTKSMFDDMYLYMKEINQKYVKNKGIDPSNGMPIQSYEEVSSHYWNMIYNTANNNSKYQTNAT